MDTPNEMYSWGPAVWHEFHVFALSPPPNQQDVRQFFMVTIPSKIACSTCFEKYMKLLRKHPIPTNTSLLFDWTVKIHNIVNFMLRKPLVSVEEARSLTSARQTRDLS